MSPKKTLIQEKSRKKRPLGKKRTTRSVSACISDDGSSSELSELGPLDVPASPIRTRRRQVQRH